uniref:Uncharacterized protein n=1 Tax=Candidatus Kentrum sp. UNK TaxID=2126344 RepID=A0A451AV82_9GAMM|nr:MAG: hypothetical protein BECKUNK1418G_GA0071005_110310 [Candidatus Kentron sp. UNK]VFK69943.1 MAG: hypothetical protein BECKUNK1418H_GA0071006_102129 [Candidatus Kentron sp. UNK]
MNILMKWAGFISALITIINLFAGWPFKPLLSFWEHRLTKIQSSESFKIETIYTESGEVINPQDKFSYKFQIPINARGSTTFKNSDFIWVVLEDQHGGYYLQHPPTKIRDGEWRSHNIRPLDGIKNILWLKVDGLGNQFFSRRAENTEWAKFTKLPDHTLIAYAEMR